MGKQHIEELGKSINNPMMKLIFLFLVLLVNYDVLAQRKLTYEIGLNTGVSTIYDSIIAPKGSFTNYKMSLNQGSSATVYYPFLKGSFALGVGYQRMTTKYKTFANLVIPGNSGRTFITYLGILNQLQLNLGYSKALAKNFELGISLQPTYLLQVQEKLSYESTIDFVGFEHLSAGQETTINNLSYKRFLLLSSVYLAKIQTFKDGANLRYSLSPQVSLTNSGRLDHLGPIVYSSNARSTLLSFSFGIAYRF